MASATVISIDDHDLFRSGIELIVRSNLAGVQFASFPSLVDAFDQAFGRRALLPPTSDAAPGGIELVNQEPRTRRSADR